MEHLQDTTTLHNGVKMPWFGLGLSGAEDGDEVANAVKTAIVHGYRSFDTAALYGNEKGVGRGIREGLQATGLSREDLFITSKVWNSDLGYESALAAYQTSLKNTGLDYLDLYLIHWPVEGKFKDGWRALETLYKEGRVKAIGVSNFHIHHLEELLKDAEIKPMVNQVEYHPLLTQKELHEFCKSHSIQLEAWSPLMQGKLLEEPLLVEIASKLEKTVAQVILRWDLQNGVVTIPKSAKEFRIVQNSQIFDFELTEEDMERISALNENKRSGADPDNFNF
ncbi:aldo/keto reductase [Planococcus liqunii]|uniref:Aldo/keto reductase n=1 Tax=Planococcus liqunii TaxID=3058394 RepID=A0ABT8MU83_9BACL|nr:MULTISPECIES: aldo/keto reductase [unclassified Planococcus (in: firmicutes)]MDN7228414.1 aldo/keto reductase [Planococcus sp. N064]WKA50920.1 aldo/keto reductase [Planococcus sp. N056]